MQAHVWVYGVVEPGWYMAMHCSGVFGSAEAAKDYTEDLLARGYLVVRSVEKPESSILKAINKIKSGAQA